MKTVYSYQEIGRAIGRGKQVAFTCYPEARVTATQKRADSDTITVTIQLSVRDTCVGIVEYEYTSMLAVLDAFDIDDLSDHASLPNPHHARTNFASLSL